MSRLCLHICSVNNFPTAAGLASSAAGYACLGRRGGVGVWGGEGGEGVQSTKSLYTMLSVHTYMQCVQHIESLLHSLLTLSVVYTCSGYIGQVVWD